MGHVVVLATGGTIASVPGEHGDYVASLGGRELVSRVGEAGAVRVDTLFVKGSYAFTLEDLHTLAQAARQYMDDPATEGIVITQGTDTLEETSFYLALVLERRKPVALTGAQLPASDPHGDGPRNLAQAIAVARDPEAAAWGPVVVFNGEIHAARDVRKVDTAALDAFKSPGWGPVGLVDRGKVIKARATRERRVLPPAVPRPVALIRLAVGVTGDHILQAATGAEGVVLQAFGRGNAHPSVADAVRRLVEAGVPVVVTSRCVGGLVAPMYGDGGGRDLERAGAWFAGDLAGEKARLLLGLLLAHGIRGQAAQEWLAEWAMP